MTGPLARRAARSARVPGGRGSCCAETTTRRCSGTGRCSSLVGGRRAPRLGPDILGEPPDFDDDARALAGRAAGARGRRRPARPAARRRDREHLEGRGALGGARLAVAAARRSGRCRAARRARGRAHPDAGGARRAAAGTARLPSSAPALSPLRRGHSLRTAGRERPYRLLVPGLSKEEATPRRRRRAGCARRTSTTRCADSASAPSPSSTRISRTGPTSRSRSRSTGRTAGRRSTSTGRSCAASSRRAPSGSSRGTTCQDAVADLQREPAARIFARAHEGDVRDERRALYRSVLVPLLVRTAEGCGGFDWDDSAFDRAYAELEESLYGEGHSYGAVAPLIGISVRHADRARRRHPRARCRHG